MADHAGFDPSKVFHYRGKGSIPWNVRRVEVDRNVKFIPDRLFKDCDQLESVLLHEGLLKIGKYAFDGCTSLRSIRCPSTVTGIGAYAFYGCSSLEEVELSQGLGEIEDWTFAGCTSLKAMQIPASVTRIGAWAFAFCTNLASADLREGLRTIGDYAFKFCRSLGGLRVPSSVDEIGVRAFDWCRGLSLVQLHENLPKMKKHAFMWSCLPESFRFVPLSDRMEEICMDDETKSMFESRLSEMGLFLIRELDEDEDEDDFDEEEDPGTVWEKCKESLGRAHEVLDYLELKRSGPVLEQAVWKAKVEDEAGDDQLLGDNAADEDGGKDARDVVRVRRQGPQLSREECSVKCGAGIVSAEVWKFLAYSPSWPQLDGSE